MRPILPFRLFTRFNLKFSHFVNWVLLSVHFDRSQIPTPKWFIHLKPDLRVCADISYLINSPLVVIYVNLYKNSSTLDLFTVEWSSQGILIHWAVNWIFYDLTSIFYLIQLGYNTTAPRKKWHMVPILLIHKIYKKLLHTVFLHFAPCF